MRRYTSAIGILFVLLSTGVPAVARDRESQLTVHADQVAGEYSVHISGHGPASTMVRLHVAGWISFDLPEINLGTPDGYKDVLTDKAGYFNTKVSLATDYFEGSLVQIDATVPDQQLHATAKYHIEAVSPNVHTRSDHVQDQ